MVTTTQRNHGLSANGLERIGADANWCLLCVKVCVSDMCLPCKTRPAPVRTHLVLHATERAVDARHGPPSEPRSTSPCGHHHIVASRVGGDGKGKGEGEKRARTNDGACAQPPIEDRVRGFLLPGPRRRILACRPPPSKSHKGMRHALARVVVCSPATCVATAGALVPLNGFRTYARAHTTNSSGRDTREPPPPICETCKRRFCQCTHAKTEELPLFVPPYDNRPPREPGPTQCCQSAPPCEACVWTVYYDDLARWRAHNQTKYVK